MLQLNFAKIIIDFIWDKVIDMITYNISILFTSKITDYIKKYMSKNSYINEHFIKYKKGSYLLKGTFNINDKTKTLYTEEYTKFINYLLNNHSNLKILKNNSNRLIQEYKIIEDCEFKLNNDIHIKIENHITNGYIISTIELYSYKKNKDFIVEYIENIKI